MSRYFGNVRKKMHPFVIFFTNNLLIFQNVNLIYKINEADCTIK